MQPDGSTFRVLTYNILARSLGSNTIPWVMNVSPSTRERIEAATGRPWAEWRKGNVDEEYKRNWHKNFASGDYSAMRRLWGRPLASAADVPDALGGLAFVGEDRVSYDKRGVATVATTLRGVLRAALGEAEGTKLFDEIADADATVYDWAARGPRVFQTCAAADADVVALAEYDVHDAEAAYAGGATTSFADAMRDAGYDGALFTDPLLGRTPPSGLGLFWRRSAFEASGGASADGAAVACGDAAGALSNHDLLERWHPLIVPPEAGVGGSDLPAKDRRNCAIARLTHRASGRTLCVALVHLMTTSRDGPGVTRYPGEVRAGELAKVREILAEAAAPEDAILMCGDFNTPPADAHVWRGDVGVAHDTGFDKGAFRWGDRELRDAFESVHGWAAAPRADVCTSKNGDRTLWTGREQEVRGVFFVRSVKRACS
mmetsp:Transcript_19275/g.60322  ORF Transcript_19275/g.60322 Transcript_19275/m.60322 type:complete len:431 (+) Transcript_19275:594-1886(+)